ncbi:MAG: hypothetical protein KatS3mg103_0857 [Phycisphaerales bacterium]|nr:MAG: hypothetical protein KatS3mg103_0857 [Phycisphaerales bacterium]
MVRMSRAIAGLSLGNRCSCAGCLPRPAGACNNPTMAPDEASKDKTGKDKSGKDEADQDEAGMAEASRADAGQESADGEHALAARARLLAHLSGVLVCEAGASPVRLVVAEAGGSVVLPMPKDLSSAGAWVYAAPQELDPAIELSLEPVPSDDAAGDDALPDADAAEADRFLAYHGSTPAGCRLVSLAVTLARYADDRGRTCVAQDVLTPNPLRAHVPALCRWLNADKDALAQACQRLAGMRPQAPVAVGVDEWGVHVRAAFDVLRLGFDRAVHDPDQARRAIEGLLGG